MKFIYVMSSEDKDTLLSMGFTLLKEHTAQHVWVFANPDTLSFSTDEKLMDAGIPHIMSDTLTF